MLMLKYLGKRIARSFLTLIIILTVVFCLLRLMPIEGYFTNFDKLTPQQIQVSLQEMGLTDPLPVQVVRFFNDLVHGDLGVSRIYRANVPVAEIRADKVPVSIKLGVLSMIVSLFVGLPMGALMARYKYRWFDKLGTLFIVCIQAFLRRSTSFISSCTERRRWESACCFRSTIRSTGFFRSSPCL